MNITLLDLKYIILENSNKNGFEVEKWNMLRINVLIFKEYMLFTINNKLQDGKKKIIYCMQKKFGNKK